MLAGDFERLLHKLSKDSSRIGIWASPKESASHNKAQIYWRDNPVCAVEKGWVPDRSYYTDDDPSKALLARGVKDTLEIVAAHGALVSDWRERARKILGGGYGF